MSKKVKIVFVFSFMISILAGCGPRKFVVRPEMMSHEFTVVQRLGTLAYTPIADARSELDKKGQKPSSCAFKGDRGITILGDENYKNRLVPEVDKHMTNAMMESGLFTELLTESAPDANYVFKGSLDQFHVVLNETKAQDTQACVGGIIGAMIASSVDVEATTDIQLTGILLKGNEELWRKSVTKHIMKIDNYSNTEKNLERCMGEAIGASSKELISEMAVYLSSK